MSLVLLSFGVNALFAAPRAHAEWSTGKKVGVGVGVAAGAYLLYRAYRNHEARQEQRYENALERQRQYYESRYDNDPGSAPDESYPSRGSDSSYDAWVQQQSQAQQQAAAQKAYDDLMASNAAKYRALSGTLGGRIESLKKSSDAPWVCASLCGEYNGAELIAKVVDSTAPTSEAALKAITAKCTGKAYLFTSIGPKSKSYELNWNPGACFANKTDAAKLVTEVADGKSIKAKMIVVDLEIVDNGTPVSAAFKHEALHSAQLVMKALDSVGGDSKAALAQAEADAAKDDPEYMKKLAEVHPIVKLSRPGHMVLGNEDKNPANNVAIVVDVLGAGAAQEVATIPLSVPHKCGDETHPVKIKIIALAGPSLKSKAYKPSEHLLAMYQDTFLDEDKDGADKFCSSSEQGGGVVKNAPSADARLAGGNGPGARSVH